MSKAGWSERARACELRVTLPRRASAPLRRTRGDGAARTRDGGPSSAAAAWRLAARGQRRVARTGRRATRHLGATWVLGGCSSTARREPRGRAGCVASERTRDGVGGAQESHTPGEAPKPSPRECILSCANSTIAAFLSRARPLLQGGPRGGGTSTSRRTAVKTEHGLTPTRREDLGGA